MSQRAHVVYAGAFSGNLGEVKKSIVESGGTAAIVYEVRPRADRRGFDVISDALPFGKLWYQDSEAAISYAQFFSRSKDIEIRIFNESGALIETRKCQGEFVEP